MDLETIIHSEESQEDKNKHYILTHKCGIRKCYRQSYLQSRNRDTDVENKRMVTKGEGGMGWLGDWNWHIYTIDTMYKIDN